MDEVVYNGLVVNQLEKLCYIDNEPIALNRKEYLTLLFLMSNPNRIFTRREIAENVWGVARSSRTIDTVINKIRHKIKEYKKNLVTRAGFGYGFFNKPL